MAEIGGVLSASSGATRSRPMKAVRFVLFSDYLVLALTALYIAALWFVVPEIVSPTNLDDIFSAGPAALRRRNGRHDGPVGGADRLLGHLDHGDGLRGRRVDHDQPGRLSRRTGLGADRRCPGDRRHWTADWALNGVCTIVFDMPSFLVTLTTMMFFSGAAIWYTAAHTSSGSSIGALPS